ncbi:trypsin beta-like [Mytilus edulis]|uniref:trypsin beta-like n=1 Tax=Mytilus edulis TaxID=6550 RepID=UPI0039EEE2B6
MTKVLSAIKAEAAIVRGDNTFIASHPWMVSVQFRQDENEDFTHSCGGAIIDKSWVLTAAHCNSFYSERPATNIRVLAGSSYLSLMDVKIPVKKYYVHEQFDLAIDGRPINDLMLLQLQKPLQFGSTIKKIDLDTDIGKNYTGELCTITGWGDTDANLGGKYPDRLQVLTMPVVTKEHCGTVWRIPKTFWNKLICLQVKDKDSCEHDSGGPVVCRELASRNTNIWW